MNFNRTGGLASKTPVCLVRLDTCEVRPVSKRVALGYSWRLLWKQEVPTMSALDWSQCPAVESIPGKVSGAWVLKGTRMPVATIFENLEAGANIDDIMEWFDGLDREQVKAVIKFAARSLDKEPAYAP